MQRITHNGHQVWPKARVTKRDPRGRFANGGAKRFFKVLLILATILLFTLFAPAFASWLDSKNNLNTQNFVSFSTPVAHAGVTIESKVEALKESILDRLAACESGGKKEVDGIAILDSNNVGSYGPFQFQRKTVIFYETKRTGKPISGRDAIILALQGDKARELAKWIIFDTGAGVENDWTNCARNPKYFPNTADAEVNIIKKLEN